MGGENNDMLQCEKILACRMRRHSSRVAIGKAYVDFWHREQLDRARIKTEPISYHFIYQREPSIK